MNNEHRLETQKNAIVLSDFDGTIVDVDTGALALSRFAKGDWKAIDRQFERGEIRFDECIQRQFRMIDAPMERILETVDTAASVRPCFLELVDVCRVRKIQFITVSGGLDFCINHILKKNNVRIQVCVPKSSFTSNGIALQFPPVHDSKSLSFKDDMVAHFRLLGFTVFYVGDGYSDYPALRLADVRFAIRESPSAKLCKENGLDFQEITDFQPVIQALGQLEGIQANAGSNLAEKNLSWGGS